MFDTMLKPADAQSIAEAAQLLREGEVVGLPTETVYGLAGSALSETAVQKIFAAKGRPQDNPLISHIADWDMLPMVARDVPRTAQLLAQAFWPGPLTMILPRSSTVADAVCAGLPTAAVRMPSHPVALEVIRACGLPLAAPSANLSGSPSPTTAQDVWNDLQGKISLVLDGGACSVGVESTVISLTEETPVLLRPGLVTKEAMEAVLGRPVLLSHAVTQQLHEGETAASPGMKYRHYAPQARVIIVKGSLEAFCAYVAARCGESVMTLCFAEDAPHMPCPCVTYGAQNSPQEQAQQLFSALRRLDVMGARTVYARCPQASGVGLAVYNRLLRAAAFCVVEADT